MSRFFHNSWGISLGLFITTTVLYFLSLSIGSQTHDLTVQNNLRERLRQNLQDIREPDKYLALLKNSPQEPLHKTLKTQAQPHYIDIRELRDLPENAIALTLKADIDHDIVRYLETLLAQYPGEISIQELGIFRDGNHAIGHVTLNLFKPSFIGGNDD